MQLKSFIRRSILVVIILDVSRTYTIEVVIKPFWITSNKQDLQSAAFLAAIGLAQVQHGEA